LDVAITKDGSSVFAVDQNKQAYFLDGATGKVKWQTTLRDISDNVAIYGSKTVRVLVATRGAQVLLFDSGGKQLWRTQLNQDVVSLEVSRNGGRVVAATLDGAVSLIDGATAKILWTTTLPTEVNCTARDRADCLNVALSGDGAFVLVGTKQGALYWLEAEQGSVLQAHQFEGAFSAVALSSEGESWLTGNSEGLVSATTTSAAAASLKTSQASQRNIILSVLVVLAVVSSLLTIWVRRTTTGRNVWQQFSTPVKMTGKQMWRSRSSYFLLLPTLALLLVFNYYPAVSGLYHSFTEWTPGLETKWVGLEQVRKMFDSSYFWVGMKNALILVVTSFLKLLFPLLVAELIFHVRRSSLQYGLRTLFVIPLVLPSVVAILLWVNIYDPNIGLLNQTLDALGLGHLTRSWLGDRNTAMAAIVAIGFPWINPFALLIFYGGLISIPTELYDAAKVDGASWWTRITRIDLPLLVSQLRLLLILVFIGSVQEFQLIFLTTAGGPANATYTPALELYYTATRFSNFGLASAMGTFLFLVILGGTILNLRFVRSRTEYQT
jgi:ABC-type sugar transport system permease subunit